MGIGPLGFNNTVFKRKFRFTFALSGICGGQSVPDSYVKISSRPKISFDEVELNFLHGKKFIPGKGTWESITVTYFDVATTDAASLYNWLASVYDFTDPTNLYMGNTPSDYAATATLSLWDGCGTLLDQWVYGEVWPQVVDFGEVDYQENDVLNIELTLRYSQVTYTPFCPKFKITPCCKPCSV